MPDLAIIDGQLMNLADATISVLDLGFLRGVGAFETLRTYNGGCPHAFDQHLDRLAGASAALGIPDCIDRGHLRQQLSEAHVRSAYDELRVNLIVTPGKHSSGVFGAEQPSVVIIIRQLQEPPATWYDDGVAAITFRGERVVPELKTTAYITGRQGLLAAEQAGAHEALYCDADGQITEGVTSNVLALRGAEIISPSAPSLDGITRRGLRLLATDLGLTWSSQPVYRDDILAADEVWICSAVRELVPIIRVDDQSIGRGKPGEWARKLRTLYRSTAEAEALRDAQQAQG